MLEVQDLYFAYDNNRKILMVSVFHSPGEIMCIFGPNGCGKTTMLTASWALTEWKRKNLLKAEAYRI